MTELTEQACGKFKLQPPAAGENPVRTVPSHITTIITISATGPVKLITLDPEWPPKITIKGPMKFTLRDYDSRTDCEYVFDPNEMTWTCTIIKSEVSKKGTKLVFGRHDESSETPNTA